MKKNRLMKVTSILAAAIMTASAMITTVSADETRSMALQNVEAAAGGTVEIPLTINFDDQCANYSVILEYDARLQFAGASSSQASSNEENGKGYASLVRFETNPIADSEAAETISFEVPKDAEIGDTFTVDFSYVEAFSSDYEEFEDYTLSGATITVTEEYDPSVEENEIAVQSLTDDGCMISFGDKEAMAGETVEVPLVMYTNNECTSFDLLIEYDARLELESAARVKSLTKHEEGGRKFAAITGYETKPYKDGEAAATLKFSVPEDADTDVYGICFSEIACIATDEDEITSYTAENGYVSVTAMGSGVKGDVNCDGQTNIKDALTIARACATRSVNDLDAKGKIYGDANEDGKITIKDASVIAKFIARGKVSWDF